VFNIKNALRGLKADQQARDHINSTCNPASRRGVSVAVSSQTNGHISHGNFSAGIGSAMRMASPREPTFKLEPGYFILTESWPEQRLAEGQSENDSADGMKMAAGTQTIRMYIPKFNERPWVVSRVKSVEYYIKGDYYIVTIDRSLAFRADQWEGVPNKYVATVNDSKIVATFETVELMEQAVAMLRLTDEAHNVIKTIFDAKQGMLDHMAKGDFLNASNVADQYRKLLGKITDPTKEFGAIVKLFAADS
jgi:hypothetical protein